MPVRLGWSQKTNRCKNTSAPICIIQLDHQVFPEEYANPESGMTEASFESSRQGLKNETNL